MRAATAYMARAKGVSYCLLLLLVHASVTSAARDAGLLLHSTDCKSSSACEHSAADISEQVWNGEPLSAEEQIVQGARRSLSSSAVPKINPYGARYTMGERALTLTDGQEHSSKQQRRQERRKAIRQKTKAGGGRPLEASHKSAAAAHSSGEPALKTSIADRVAGEDSSYKAAVAHSLGEPALKTSGAERAADADELADLLSTAHSKSKGRSHSKGAAAAFDSAALEDHVASDLSNEQDLNLLEVELGGGGYEEEEAEMVPKSAHSGNGQLGIGGAEKAGGVDSSGVTEHIHSEPTVLSAAASAENGTQLDASGAHMPIKARAAGVDSSAMSGHIAEDVGEELLVTSGTIESKATPATSSSADASDREVVKATHGDGALDGATFNQQAIREAADDVLARPGSDEEVDVSAVGLMPTDWASSAEHTEKERT